MLISRTLFPKGSGQQLFNCTATYPTRSLAQTEGQWEEADHRTWQKTHCWPPPLQTPQTSQNTYIFGSQELHPIGHLEAEAHQVHVAEEWRLIYQCHPVCPFRSWRASRDGCWCYQHQRWMLVSPSTLVSLPVVEKHTRECSTSRNKGTQLGALIVRTPSAASGQVPEVTLASKGIQHPKNKHLSLLLWPGCYLRGSSCPVHRGCHS